MSEQDLESGPLEGIAVVGMAGRFPGADDLGELWRNLCGGVESVRFYSREELDAAGVSPALLDDSRYVRAGAPCATCSISTPTSSTSARARRS